MGNEYTVPDRHVSFESGDPTDGGGFGSPRSSYRGSTHLEGRDPYDLQGPQMRSRESTFSLGQRIQDRAQGGQRTLDTVDEVLEDRRVRYNRSIPANSRETWYEDGYDAGRFYSTRRPVRVGPNNRVTTRTTYYPETSRMTRSYQSTDYPDGRSPSRAFNTRDQNDIWYNYRPEVNRRADWALVGRHVVRPASAAVEGPPGARSRVFYDNDSASSDPTSDRLRRGTGPGLVRRTDNPRVYKGGRTVYWENEDDAGAVGPGWSSQTRYTYQRPTHNYYQTYRR